MAGLLETERLILREYIEADSSRALGDGPVSNRPLASPGDYRRSRRSAIVTATMSFKTPAAVTSAPAPGPVTTRGLIL